MFDFETLGHVHVYRIGKVRIDTAAHRIVTALIFNVVVSF